METIKNLKIDWLWVRSQVLKRERIPAGQDNAIRKGAEACLKKAKILARPKISMTAKKITASGAGYIGLDGNLKLRGKFLSSSLKGAFEIRAFVVTIGSGIEKAATSLMAKGDMLKGYLMDRIGSFAVESLATDAEEKIRALYAAKNLSVSNRYSPGYCDWPIEEQVKLAGILDFSKAGVRLNESCMMTPKKSISAIVGIGKKNLFSKRKHVCAICDMVKRCDYSRI